MLASAVSVPASLLGGLGYLSQLAGHVRNRFRPDSEYVPADPYRPSMSYQYAADAIRGGAAEAIADSWAGRPGAFLYQTGMSMADSGVAAALTAGTGLPAAALLGGSAAIAGGIRYLLVVLFAGCVWPLTFWWFSRLGRR